MTALYHESIPNVPGIYRITCITTGKFYIGSSVNLQRRRHDHFKDLQGNNHANPKLQHAYQKYGLEAFVFETLEYVMFPEMLTTREQYWLDKLQPFGKNGFNIATVAGSSLGIKRSLESRAKMSAAKQGVSNSHRIGAKHTSEARKRIGAAHIGKQESEETRHRKRESALKRLPASQESIEKTRLANLGRVTSQDTRKKIQTSNTWRMKTLLVTSPNGDEFPVTGIKQFCREHNLHDSCLISVAKGKSSHHKGWKARYIEDAS